MEENNQNTFWEELMHHKHALFISFFSAILVTAFILLSVYNTDSRFFQGYLKSLKTTTGGDIGLQFEHLVVFNAETGTASLKFYVDNLGSNQLKGFSLKFNNWPNYLNYKESKVHTDLTDWGTFETANDLKTEFEKTNPQIAYYTSGSKYLRNGEIVEIVFNVDNAVSIEKKNVEVKGVFSNETSNYETPVGIFSIAPKSRFSLSHPAVIQPTSSIQIPFTLNGASNEYPVYGFTVQIENMPTYMTMNENSLVRGNLVSSTDNWKSQVNYEEDIKTFSFINLSQDNGIKQSGQVVATLNLSIASSATVTIPAKPMVVNVEFVSGGTSLVYAQSSNIQIGGTNGTVADICSRGPGGDIVHQVGIDGIIGISDLHCMVTEWAKTGNNLSANIYKVPPSQDKVDIRDLTVLLSQYSKEPDIQSISPQEGPVTTQISITGSDFYASQPSSVVELYLVKKDNPNIKHLLTERSRTNTAITASVPTNVPLGDYKFQIIVGKELSVTRPGFKVK